MTAGDDVQLVSFRLGGQEFAFNIFQVERILRYETPTRLPKAPEFLEGVLQYQGAPVPVVDLRKRLGVAAPQRDDTRVVVLETDGNRIAAVVDSVTEVLQVPAAQVTPPAPIVKGLAAEYIAGIVVRDARTIIVLNTAKLLSSQERLQLEAVLQAGAPAADATA
jgi:purine-binding chemotaxis protein CheW